MQISTVICKKEFNITFDVDVDEYTIEPGTIMRLEIDDYGLHTLHYNGLEQCISGMFADCHFAEYIHEDFIKKDEMEL